MFCSSALLCSSVVLQCCVVLLCSSVVLCRSVVLSQCCVVVVVGQVRGLAVGVVEFRVHDLVDHHPPLERGIGRSSCVSALRPSMGLMVNPFGDPAAGITRSRNST